MTVIEDNLKLEKRKTKVQGKILGQMMSSLRANQEEIEGKIQWMKDNNYNHDGWQKQLDEITRILDHAVSEHKSLRLELQGEKDNINKITHY